MLCAVIFLTLNKSDPIIQLNKISGKVLADFGVVSAEREFIRVMCASDWAPNVGHNEKFRERSDRDRIW